MASTPLLYPPPQTQASPKGGFAQSLLGGAGDARTQVAAGGTFGPDPSKPASYVIVDRATGKAVMETFDHDLIPRLNTQKYEAVPIQIWLGSLNRGG